MQMFKGCDRQSGKVFFFAHIREANYATCLPSRYWKPFTKTEAPRTRYGFEVPKQVWRRAEKRRAFQDHPQVVDDPKDTNIPAQTCGQQLQRSLSGRTLIGRLGKQTSHYVSDVPVVLRAQSVYQGLIGHGAIVLNQFLAAIRKEVWGIRPCRSYRARFAAAETTFGCAVISRLVWSNIRPSCQDQGPLASRLKESVEGLHLWRQAQLAERAERISSAVSLL